MKNLTQWHNYNRPDPKPEVEAKFCSKCYTLLRQMSSQWSKCPNCGFRIYHGKINDVAAMPNAAGEPQPPKTKKETNAN
jgi:PHP family Zn ribbon phosphoesterase